MNRELLEHLARRWQRQIVAREVLFALAVANLAVPLFLWHGAALAWLIVLLAIGTLAVRFTLSRPWRLDAAAVGRHLDRTHPELEESAALFLRPTGELTLLERLQKQRIDRRFPAPSNTSPGKPPPGFLRPAWWCLGAAILLSVIVRWALPPPQPGGTSHPKDVMVKPAGTAANQPPGVPRIIANIFTVTPPAYTHRPERRVDGFTVEAEEGAQIRWNVALDQPVQDCRLVAGSQAIPLHPMDGSHWEGGDEIRDSALFSLVGTLPDGTAWNPPEIFSVKGLKDRPPVVRITQPAQTRAELDPSAPGPVTIEAVVSDDYGVAGARLVATVAKGSGESVKFREQSIPFDGNVPADSPGTYRFTKTLDPAALGMSPGDELYFYVEGTDNQQPRANVARSETRFLLLRGPEERPTSVGRGVAGVNLVPQYFRSERQIIIDTEKLLADQPTLPDTDFRARANDLGADQALLRLRYGRFLGEDQEEGLFTDHKETLLNPLQVTPPEHAVGPRAAASVAQRFRQEHTQQDQEGGPEDAAPGAPVDRSLPPTAEQVRQPFVDSHDIHDKNTFFDGNTQGNMRDALAAMWEAEKLLRTVRPAEALAPEHRALDILKDLQQSARAYVQHVGFEAPPLKVAERRLKGDAADVPPRSTALSNGTNIDPAMSDVREALVMLSGNSVLLPELAAKVEPALAAAATRQPEEFLSGLRALRTGSRSVADLAALRRALLRLLPPAKPLPERAEASTGTLAARYFQALQAPEEPPR